MIHKLIHKPGPTRPPGPGLEAGQSGMRIAPYFRTPGKLQKAWNRTDRDRPPAKQRPARRREGPRNGRRRRGRSDGTMTTRPASASASTRSSTRRSKRRFRRATRRRSRRSPVERSCRAGARARHQAPRRLGQAYGGRCRRGGSRRRPAGRTRPHAGGSAPSAEAPVGYLPLGVLPAVRRAAGQGRGPAGRSQGAWGGSRSADLGRNRKARFLSGSPPTARQPMRALYLRPFSNLADVGSQAVP